MKEIDFELEMDLGLRYEVEVRGGTKLQWGGVVLVVVVMKIYVILLLVMLLVFKF